MRGGLIALLTMGVAGVMLAIYPLDWQLHDTHFAVARFHYVCSKRVRHDTPPAAMGWPLNTY